VIASTKGSGGSLADAAYSRQLGEELTKILNKQVVSVCIKSVYKVSGRTLTSDGGFGCRS